jgi:hypothetical protein
LPGSFAFRKLSKIWPMTVFGLGVGVGVGADFGVGVGVAECLAIARFKALGEGSGDAVGDGGTFVEFSSAFGDSMGVASIGLGEATGVKLGVGIDSRVGLAFGTTF